MSHRLSWLENKRENESVRKKDTAVYCLDSLLAWLSTNGRAVGLYSKYKGLYHTLAHGGYISVPPFTVIIPLTDSPYTPIHLALLPEHGHGRTYMRILLQGIRTRYTRVFLTIDNEWQKKPVVVANRIGKRDRKLAIRVRGVLADDFQHKIPAQYISTPG